MNADYTAAPIHMEGTTLIDASNSKEQMTRAFNTMNNKNPSTFFSLKINELRRLII